MRKVRKNFYLNLKMLGEGGYVDLTCTRYGPMDLYGDMIQKAGEESIILWKPAYIRKPHAIEIEEDDLTEHDVILQFPEQLSWEFLQTEKALDPETFYTQYLNIAEGNFKPTFPIDRLNAAKIESDESHQTGAVHIAWRFEYAESKYAACAVGMERDGRMTIVDVQRGQFTPTALAKRLVATARHWETHRVMIEDTPGAQTMLEPIQNQALEAHWRIEILWGQFLSDTTARAMAIKSAEPAPARRSAAVRRWLQEPAGGPPAALPLRHGRGHRRRQRDRARGRAAAPVDRRPELQRRRRRGLPGLRPARCLLPGLRPGALLPRRAAEATGSRGRGVGAAER